MVSRWFGKTHPEWRSPATALTTLTCFSFILLLFLAGILQQTHADGSSSYAFGLPQGGYTQTDGAVSFGWVAIVGTMVILCVYILVNAAALVSASRSPRTRWFVLTRVLAPVGSSLVLLIPLASFVMPTLPGPPGIFFTRLGFAPTPFPLNILPLFVVVWGASGVIYLVALARQHPQRFALLKREEAQE